MNAKEFYRKNKETISAPLDDNWMENAVSQMMEAYLSHKIEEAEKSITLNFETIKWDLDQRMWLKGFKEAISKLKES